MKFSLVLMIAMATISSKVFSQVNYALPQTWTKDLVITASRGGGSLYQKMSIKITYDSCRFDQIIQNKATKNAFLMTPALRAELLNKLHQLKADKIRPSSEIALSYDKTTSAITFQDDHGLFWAADGDLSQIHEDDEKNFREAFNSLVTFATTKHKKRSRN